MNERGATEKFSEHKGREATKGLETGGMPAKLTRGIVEVTDCIDTGAVRATTGCVTALERNV